jgi:glutaredoxin
MSKYYFHIVYLENCPYGKAALDELNQRKIRYTETSVNHTNKDNYKINMQTFPQIYLKKDKSNESLLLGGYSDLEYTIQNLNINNYIEFQNKYKQFSKKSILRLIELLNIN